MNNAAYLYGLSGCSLLLVLAGTCWWWQRKRHACWNIQTDEKKPLLPASQRRVSNVIAKFETQEAANKTKENPLSKNCQKRISGGWSRVSKRRSKIAPLDTRKEGKKFDRCPACRKVFSLATSARTVIFQDQKLHQSCFQCCDCQTNLLDHDPKTVTEYVAAVRVRFQCQACCQKFNGKQQQDCHTRAVQPRGGSVVIDHHEKGDTKQTMEKIGDALSEAVFFMHPKCSVCGGDFDDKDNNKQMAKETRGNWRYHEECWDKGKPTVPSDIPKLTPAHSAKYLPDQIILQLRGQEENILTTLFFVWKNKEENVKELKQTRKNDTVVDVLYTLDDEAPANPNYKPQTIYSPVIHPQLEVMKKQPKSSTTKGLVLPRAATTNGIVKDLQLKLLLEEKVAPRPPTLVEPVSIVHVDSDAEDGEKSYLSAKLEYLKFGLHYVMALQIPFEDEERTKIDLVEALLSVTIQKT